MNKSLLMGLSAAIMAGLLAGCAGSASSPTGTTNAMPLTAQSIAQPTTARPIAIAAMNGKCTSNNGVSVKPCSVKLTLSDPAQTVTTKGPNDGTFTLKDMRCTKKDVATVAGSGNDYTVTAGASTGMCTAKFVDNDAKGNKIGTAKLSINNQV